MTFETGGGQNHLQESIQRQKYSEKNFFQETPTLNCDLEKEEAQNADIGRTMRELNDQYVTDSKGRKIAFQELG